MGGPDQSAKILQCMERDISYQNALLSFGKTIKLTSRKKCWCIGVRKTKSFGGGKLERLGGSFPPPPPPPPHWIEPWFSDSCVIKLLRKLCTSYIISEICPL